ncbi:MAG: hypothetical protein J2P31_11690 [Blastocatellia bacterium]|nr:hypothetical protein [Blastocatellia bacterium]
MHNIDRTNLESVYGEFPGEYEGEYGNEYEYEQEFESSGEYSQEGPFSEAEEMELAAELLSVSNEAELDQFFGDIFKKAAKAVGGLIKSPIGKALGGALKGVVKQALPMVGSAVGNIIAPGVGGAIGGQLAAGAGNLLGLELEGLSNEDQEFEVAKGVVRLAGAAATNAAQAPPATPPQQVVQTALTEAAQQHAPGLLSSSANTQTAHPHHGRCSHKNHGRWLRRGKAIILVGA